MTMPVPRRPPPPTAWGSIIAPRAPDPHRVDRHLELDGHRGIAVIAITVYHVYQFSNTYHYLYLGTPAYTLLNSLDAAVPWFFVLSAFVLFEPIARAAVEAEPPISARDFLGRRAVRLLPVYYVAVIVVWFLRQRHLPGDWRDLLEHLTFTQVFDPQRIFYTDGPAWSLSVAVYFFLVLMVLSSALARICRRLPSRGRRIAALVGGTAALAAGSLAWKSWSFGIRHRPTTGAFTTWFGPAANLDNFAAGMAVALIVASLGNRRPLSSRGRLQVRLLGLAILAAAFLSRHANTWPAVYFSSICSAGFGCLVAAAVLGPPDDRWARTLSWPPLRWLGAISLSVYLWHEPITLALRAPAGPIHQNYGAFLTNTIVIVPISILVGWLSYTLIERPTGQLSGILPAGGHPAPASAADQAAPVGRETAPASDPI